MSYIAHQKARGLSALLLIELLKVFPKLLDHVFAKQAEVIVDVSAREDVIGAFIKIASAAEKR